MFTELGTLLENFTNKVNLASKLVCDFLPIILRLIHSFYEISKPKQRSMDSSRKLKFAFEIEGKPFTNIHIRQKLFLLTLSNDPIQNITRF